MKKVALYLSIALVALVRGEPPPSAKEILASVRMQEAQQQMLQAEPRLT